MSRAPSLNLQAHEHTLHLPKVALSDEVLQQKQTVNTCNTKVNGEVFPCSPVY